MTDSTKRRFFILGRTRGERIANVLGLILLIGFLSSRSCQTAVTTGYELRVPATEVGLATQQEIVTVLQSFSPDHNAIRATAKAVGVTDEQLQSIDLSFSVSKNDRSVVMEFESALAAHQSRPLFDEYSRQLRNHLKKSTATPKQVLKSTDPLSVGSRLS